MQSNELREALLELRTNATSDRSYMSEAGFDAAIARVRGTAYSRDELVEIIGAVVDEEVWTVEGIADRIAAPAGRD